jgi:hypothetical protein
MKRNCTTHYTISRCINEGNARSDELRTIRDETTGKPGETSSNDGAKARMDTRCGVDRGGLPDGHRRGTGDLRVLLPLAEVLTKENRAYAAERSIAARERMAHAGLVLGGPSYGYDDVAKAPGVLVINAAQAKVIRWVAESMAEGKPPRAIARALNADGIPSPSGRTWTSTAVMALMRKEIYAGLVVYKATRRRYDERSRRRMCRRNPPDAAIRRRNERLRIVPQEVWDAAKAAMRARAVRYWGRRD